MKDGDAKMHDLIIIGAGPGGYISAIKAAEVGLKVAVIERGDIGGTCLNVGCIPSKTYIQHGKWAETAAIAKQFGIDLTLSGVDFGQLHAHKDQVVSQLQQGIRYLFKKHGVDYIQGEAKVLDENHVQVDQTIHECKDILLATGSRPFVPPIKGLDDVDYLTTDTFFNLKTLPEKLTIVGGGIIAIELAFAMAPLGVEVTVLEVAPDILLVIDEAARQLVKKRMQAMGIVAHVGVNIDAVTPGKIHTKEAGSFDFTHLLVATGRRADLSLANALKLELDSAQRNVKVDAHYQTSVPHIYAAGDMIGGYMLAHAASAEGIKAVMAISGHPEDPVDPNLVPRCLYSVPEVASFGLSEEDAKTAGYEVAVAEVPYVSNAKAIATDETTGFVRLISETQYHQILGAVIVGHNATELIHELIASAQSEATADELAQTIFAHPTLSELIGDTANTLLGRSVNA